MSPTRRRAAANAEVSLHLLDLDGGWVDVHWDRETYPYLVGGALGRAGGPLITVLRRLQQHGLVLAVDPRTGETQVHAELADPRWVEPVAGTPAHLPDGRVLVGGELGPRRLRRPLPVRRRQPAHPARRSTYGGWWAGCRPERDRADLLVEASDGEPGRAAPVPGAHGDRRRAWRPAGSPASRAGTPPPSAATCW